MSTEYYRSMPVVEIPQDSTGTILEVTVTSNGSALDISGASGDKLFYCKDISGVAVVAGDAASFTTDGSDGKVEFTLTAGVVGTVRDLIAEFEVQGYNSGNLITYPLRLRIGGRAKVA